MSKLKLVSFFARYGVAVAVGVGVALLLTGEGLRFKREQAASNRPELAQPTKDSENWPSMAVPCADGSAVVYREPERGDLEKLAEKWGLRVVPAAHVGASRAQTPSGVSSPAASGVEGSGGLLDGFALASALGPLRLLGEVEDSRPAPYGVEVLGALSESGQVLRYIRPKEAPLFELPARWEFYVEGGPSSEGQSAAVGAVLDGLRFARGHLGVHGAATWAEEAGAGWLLRARLSYK